MTMMACSQEAEALDRRFLEALAKVVAFAVEGDALTLAGVEGRVVLRFVDQP